MLLIFLHQVKLELSGVETPLVQRTLLWRRLVQLFLANLDLFGMLKAYYYSVSMREKGKEQY